MAKAYETWVLQAVDDFQSAEILARGGKHSWACYLAAQSAEKALKAVLLYLGRNPGHTHSLNTLLNDLAEMGVALPGLSGKRHAARLLTRVDAGARYPMDSEAPKNLYAAEDSEEALRYAREFLDLAVGQVYSRSLNDYLAESAAGKEPGSGD